MTGAALELELGPPPVPPLGVVPDGVARPHADPLRDGAVLLQLLGQLSLDAHGLVGRLKKKESIDMMRTSRRKTPLAQALRKEKKFLIMLCRTKKLTSVLTTKTCYLNNYLY